MLNASLSREQPLDYNGKQHADGYLNRPDNVRVSVPVDSWLST